MSLSSKDIILNLVSLLGATLLTLVVGCSCPHFTDCLVVDEVEDEDEVDTMWMRSSSLLLVLKLSITAGPEGADPPPDKDVAT